MRASGHDEQGSQDGRGGASSESKLVCRVVAISTGESERKGDESEEGDAAIGSQLKRS